MQDRDRKMKTVLKIVPFEKHRLTKREDEDAECSICRKGYGNTKYFYIFHDLQLCDDCIVMLSDGCY